jgi:hypothetical protein
VTEAEDRLTRLPYGKASDDSFCFVCAMTISFLKNKSTWFLTKTSAFELMDELLEFGVALNLKSKS